MASPRCRRSARARNAAPRLGQRGRETYGFPSSLNSYFSLVRIDWVQTVDCVSRKRTRQSGYLSVSFSAFSQFTDSVLLHIRFTLRRRDITVSRNSLAWIFCTTPTNCTRYTVGRDDSAHRLYPTCTIYPVGRPLATHTTVNRHVNFPFSIINSQLLQIAKCNLSLQHLLRDQPQIGIIQLPFGLHAAQQHLIHRQHRVERLLRE